MERTEFVKAELETALSFCQLAESDDDERRVCSLENAKAAYAEAIEMLGRLRPGDEDSTHGLTALRTEVEAEFDRLGEHV